MHIKMKNNPEKYDEKDKSELKGKKCIHKIYL